jgi:integrase
MERSPRNPCRIPGAGQASSPERPLLDLEAVARLADAVPGYLRALVLTAFWGHLRLGELLALRRGHVVLWAGTLRIARQVVEVRGQGPIETPPKPGSVRVVHLPFQARQALAAHLSEQGSGLPTARVFRRADGGPLRQHHVEWHWRVARQRAGYPDAHLHDLRHAGLTLAAQSGATLAEVMRRAGHSSSRAAMLYQHAVERRDAEINR